MHVSSSPLHLRQHIQNVRKYANAIKHNQKILCADAFALNNNIATSSLIKWIQSEGHTYLSTKSSQEYLKQLQTANVLILPPLLLQQSPFSRNTIESLSNLNLIITDNVTNFDLQAAWDRNITVLDCNNSSKTVDIAQETAGKMFALLRNNSSFVDENMREYKIGCIAGPQTGKLLLNRFAEYKCQLHFHDPNNALVNNNYSYLSGVGVCGVVYHSCFEEMLPLLDVLIIRCALKNNNGFDMEMIRKKCKNSIHIIDMSEVLNENEVMKAVNDGVLGGYFGNNMIVKDDMCNNFGIGFRNHYKKVSVKYNGQIQNNVSVRQLLEKYLSGESYPMDCVIIDPSRDIVSKYVHYIDTLDECAH